MTEHKTGFTPLKIAALVVGGIAIVTHITAVAYPEWDGIDVLWTPPIPGIRPKPIKSQGSLWDLSFDDPSHNFFTPSKDIIETSWKKPIVLLATTGIGLGVLGEIMILCTALLGLFTGRVMFHACAYLTTFSFLFCAAFEVLMGAILYKYNYERPQKADSRVYNVLHLPFGEHKLRAGFYLECAAGGLFILTLLITYTDIIYYDRRDTQSVSPSVNEENPKITNE